MPLFLNPIKTFQFLSYLTSGTLNIVDSLSFSKYSSFYISTLLPNLLCRVPFFHLPFKVYYFLGLSPMSHDNKASLNVSAT